MVLKTFAHSEGGKYELMTDYLSALATAIEKHLGPLTLSQMLFVVHTVSGSLAAQTAYHKGYEDGLLDGQKRNNSAGMMSRLFSGGNKKGGANA